MTNILPGAEPFFFEGDDRAVLLLHGFTGSTQSLRFIGEELNRTFGFTVSGPRLAGHGTSPDDMEQTGYLDWLGSAEDAMHELARQRKRVYVAGLSMGGALTLNLAARFPEIVKGIVPINAAAGILDGGMAELVMSRSAPARVPGIGSDIKMQGPVELAYAEVPVHCIRQVYILLAATGDLMHKITCPTLVIQSREDHVVPPANGRRIAERVQSADLRMLWLENSYHVATLDADKELIAASAGEFIADISRR
jgi:carboxylesterase